MAAVDVLVVEDDPTLAWAIERNLTARGYAVRSAATVEAALRALGDGVPRLALLDIDLPDGSGWDIARHLRQAKTASPEVLPEAWPKVLVMSALRPNQRLVQDLAVAGMLEKPFPMESLLRLVASCLGGSTDASPAEAGLEG